MSDLIQPKLKENSFEFILTGGSDIVPIDLRKYIDNPSQIPLKFSAELSLGGPLPANLTCSEEGVISGFLERKEATFLPFSVLVVALGEGVDPLTFDVYLHVEGVPEAVAETDEANAGVDEPDEFDLAQFDDYWKNFQEKLELPDLETLLTRKVTHREIYHLLGKFATLTIWNADDFRPADEGKILEIKGAGGHFLVYDFDVALVTTPRDLYSTTRTDADLRQVAGAMVREAYHRKWNIELAGFDKLVSAAWVEAQQLNRQAAEGAFKIEVKNFLPSTADWRQLSVRMSK